MDSQENILKCDVIKVMSPIQLDQSCYDNIFGRHVARIDEAAKVLARAMEIRSNILNPDIEEEDHTAQ